MADLCQHSETLVTELANMEGAIGVTVQGR